MPKSFPAETFAVPVLACVAVAGAGLWLGFTSCGGYVWNTYAGNALGALGMLVAAAPRRPALARLGWAVAVLTGFFIARGVGFALYSGASTPGEYLRHVGSTFSSGLC